MFQKTFTVLLLILCLVPRCMAQSGSTELILSPTLLPADGLTKPQDFRIEWKPAQPQNNVTIELIFVGADNKPHRFPAKSTNGRTFLVSKVSLPALPKANLVSLSVRDSRSDITCDAEDKEISVAGKSLRLSQIREIVREGADITVFAEGQKHAGPVKGLEAVSAEIARAKVTLNLSQADRITLVPIVRSPGPISYQIVARQGNKILSERAGTLMLTGTGGLGQPALDPNKDIELLVSNYHAHSVKRFHGKTGAFVDDFAFGNGMDSPHAIAIGPDGLLYVGSEHSSTVHRFDGRTGQFLDIFVRPENGEPRGVKGIAFGSDGNLYLSSVVTNKVRRYNGRTGAFMDDFITSEQGGLVNPIHLLFGPDGHLYVGTNQVIKRFHGKTGAFINDFAGMNGMNGISGFAFGPDGNLYVCSAETHEIKRFDGKTGAFIDTFVPSGRGELHLPMALAFGPDGTIYVACRRKNEIKRYHARTGAFVDIFASGGGMNIPSYLLFRNAPAPLRINQNEKQP